MKRQITIWTKAILLAIVLSASTVLNAAVEDFELSVRNLTQTATNRLEFDVYLLDTDAGQTFELASCQLGFLINSLIYTGGSITVTIDNSGSGLNATQQFPSPSINSSLSGYPDQTLIRLAAGLPVSPGGGTIISTTSPGTLMTHFIITSTVDFTANSTPNLVFNASTATAPLYPTRVAEFISSTSTQLTVTPGVNAIVYDNPVLNPPAPVQYTVTGGGSYCEGGSGVAVGLSDSEVGVTYTLLRGGVDLAPTVAGTGSAISFGNQTVAGTYTVEGTNAGGTTTMSGSAVVTVDPLPVAAGTISGTTPVCQGETSVAYTVPTITNATSYQWVYSGTGATIFGTTNSVTINFASNATSGNLTVRGVNTCGNGTFSPAYAITVNSVPAPAGTITGTSTVCQGQSGVSYSVPTISGATNYLWSYSGSGASISGSSNSVSITFSASATSGNLTVRGANSCGTGTVSSNYAITVNQLPGAAGNISGTSTVCQGQGGIAYSVSSITGATSYLWTYSGTGATITGTTNSVSISFASNATSGNLTVRGVNSCGTGTVSANYPITVNPLPGAAGTISGTSSVCQGQSGVTYSVPTISNATTYLWAYSGTGANITGTSNSVSISFADNATSGNLTVTGVNSCGNGSVSAAYPVTVNQLPGAAGTITGTATVCRGTSSVAYSVPAITGAASYLWSYSGTGATINGTTNSITIDFAANATSGTLTVRGVNSCGSGTVSPGYSITVNALPVVSAGTDASIPNGTSTTLSGSVTGTGPFTYSWTPAASVTNPSSLTTNTVNLTATTIFTLTATSSSTGCSNSDQVTITVTGGALGASATATPNSICAGSSTQLAANATGGSGSYTYAWTSNPAGFTSSAASPIAAPSVNTTYYVTVNDGFSSANSQVSVTVTAVPTITGTTPASRCGTGTVTLGATASAGTINWYSSSTGGTSLGTGTSFTTPSISSTTTYYVDATNNSCTTASRTAVTATINSLPTVNAGTDVSIPNGTSTTLTGIVTGTGPFTYSWTPAASVTNPASLSTSTVNLTTTTTFTLTATSSSTGCSSSDQVIVTISGGALNASATATPNTICAGSSTQLAANPSGGSGSYTYAWTSNPAGFTSSSATPTASPTVNTTYSVTVNDGFSSVNSQVAVTVNAVPSAPVVGTITQPSCTVSTGSVVLSGLPSGSWTINPGNRTGSTTSTTITGLTPGSYTFTVTNSSGCTSPASSEVVINTQPAVPSRPVVGTVTQPTCVVATGSVELSGLPSTGTWILRQYPGGTQTSGSGTTATVTSLPQGTYNFSVENEGGCISLLSDNAVINAQPPTPSAPVIGTITHPTYTVPTGSVVLTGLPSGTWTLTRYPDEAETTGSGTSHTIIGLEPGTYTFTVTNAVGCTSAQSSDVVINPRPGTPDLFITNPATICSNETVDLTLPAVTAGSDEDLTLTYWTDLMATVPLTNPASAPPGTYYIKGTNLQEFYAIKPVVVAADERPAPNAGPDQVLEYVFGTTLDADIPESGTGLWALVSGTGQIFNSAAPSTAVSGLSLGDNTFSWTVTNGACDPVADLIVIKVNGLIIPTLITPNQDGRNDFFVLRGLETMGRTDLTIFDRRGLKVYENSNYDNSWEGLDYNGNPLPDDTYFYVIRSDSGISISGYIVVRR